MQRSAGICCATALVLLSIPESLSFSHPTCQAVSAKIDASCRLAGRGLCWYLYIYIYTILQARARVCVCVCVCLCVCACVCVQIHWVETPSVQVDFVDNFNVEGI